MNRKKQIATNQAQAKVNPPARVNAAAETTTYSRVKKNKNKK